MKITIKTIYKGENYIISNMYLNGVFFTNTIEDKIRDLNNDGDLNDPGEEKVYGKTAIPKGIYTLILNYSPKFKRILPRILNVPHFDGILIHNGVDENSSAGCLILGDNKIKGQVTNSKKRLEEFITKLLDSGDKKHVIEIIR
jgi:hypothetical protein